MTGLFNFSGDRRQWFVWAGRTAAGAGAAAAGLGASTTEAVAYDFIANCRRIEDTVGANSGVLRPTFRFGVKPRGGRNTTGDTAILTRDIGDLKKGTRVNVEMDTVTDADLRALGLTRPQMRGIKVGAAAACGMQIGNFRGNPGIGAPHRSPGD